MNSLNLEAAAQNWVMVETIYGPRRASKRSFLITRDLLDLHKGDRVRLIGNGFDRDAQISWEISVNTLEKDGRTYDVPINALKPL